MALILLKKPYTPFVFVSASRDFNVYGKSFFNITGIYLSGYPYPNMTLYSPFSASPRLSASNPAFFGVKLLSSQFTTNNDNTITLTMPSAVRPGYVDVIVQNDAGYGKITQYAIYNTINPYTSGTSEYSNFTPYQVLWKDGIVVSELP
jgi:hypothetical protein